MSFSIKSDQLIDLTLSLQRINDIALPFAVQGALNAAARDVKKRTLAIVTNKMFDVKKRTFFKANSAFKSFKARDVGYNINRLKAEVGITKGTRPKEKATEQVGSQQTAKNIKRSVNPLGTKPITKSIIDILSKKPIIYDYTKEGGFKPEKFFRAMGRAKQKGAPFLRMNSSKGRGTLHKVKSMRRFKAGKRKGRIKYVLQPIASYIRGGEVKLKKRKPFLNKASEKSMNDVLEKAFIKEAKIQSERAMKRRG